MEIDRFDEEAARIAPCTCGLLEKFPPVLQDTPLLRNPRNHKKLCAFAMCTLGMVKP